MMCQNFTFCFLLFYIGAHFGVTRGLVLRELPGDLVNAKDEDFVPGQESSKKAENFVGIWKEQIEQV